MARFTLHKYLKETRLELLEEISAIKDRIINEECDDDDKLNLIKAEAELNCITTIIGICEDRSRF